LRDQGKVIATPVGRKIFYRKENLDRFFAEVEHIEQGSPGQAA
jgi:hypothetical protein